VLTLDGVSKVYKVGTFGGKELSAVRNVSFAVDAGEVVSLIGESGSGKTTVGKMILRLIDISNGRIDLDGDDISAIKGQDLRAYYRRVQGVFQDPFSSFNPMYKADHALTMMRDQYFSDVGAARWTSKVEASLEAVSLNPGQVLNKFPHQLSGGQLQRILIARALLLEIEFLVADEIISMLDASTRIDVLNLLGELKARGLGILFITHDLSLGNYISEKTVILRRGAVVEMGTTDRVFGSPRHPYTKTLLSCVPNLHQKWSEVEEHLMMDAIAAEPCAYHAMYPSGQAAGGTGEPEPALAEVEKGHFVACFRLDEPETC
jgi:peptide/nickel transport system ATP-binding protein